MKELRKKIDDLGIKHVFIADKLSISKGYLSMMLSGAAPMSEENEQKIKDMLKIAV